MDEKSFSIEEALKEGWKYTKENIGFLIGYQIILFLLMVLFGGKSDSVFGVLWHLIGWLIIIAAKMGLYNSCLMIIAGIKPGLDQLYQNWGLVLSWIVAGFLLAIMIVVGLILLIVPGLYVWARFGFFPFFILDKKMGPIEALQAASQATEGIRWQVFLLFLTCLALDILGLLLLGVGLLITAPITLLAMATVYRKITDKKGTVELIVPDDIKDRYSK